MYTSDMNVCLLVRAAKGSRLPNSKRELIIPSAVEHYVMENIRI